MSYYIGSNLSKDSPFFTSSTLHETRNVTERTYLHRTYDKVRHVSAAEAHRWVKTGGHHSTALYVGDDGRIRRATEERG